MEKTISSECYTVHFFKADRTSTDENPRPGRPSTSTNDDNIDAVHAMIRKESTSRFRNIRTAFVDL